MYYGYSTWDYINGRVMTINRCWNGLPQDPNTTFTWTPGQIFIQSNGQSFPRNFTLNELEFTAGDTSYYQAPYPVSEYIQRIKSAKKLDLISNIINFLPSDQPGVPAVFSLANKV